MAVTMTRPELAARAGSPRYPIDVALGIGAAGPTGAAGAGGCWPLDPCARPSGGHHMAAEYEVLREVHRITEWRGGAVFRTEYVEDVWVPDGAEPWPGYQYVVKGSGYDGPTIRRRRDA